MYDIFRYILVSHFVLFCFVLLYFAFNRSGTVAQNLYSTKP